MRMIGHACHHVASVPGRPSHTHFGRHASMSRPHRAVLRRSQTPKQPSPDADDLLDNNLEPTAPSTLPTIDLGLDEDPRVAQPPEPSTSAHPSAGGQPPSRWTPRLGRQRSINEQVALVINSSASNVVGFRKRQQPLPLTSNDDATSYDELDDASRSPLAPRTQLRPLSELFSEGLERLRYLYYYHAPPQNWRQGNWSDLQLFLSLNAALVVVASAIKHTLLDDLDNCQDVCQKEWWLDFYTVSVWVFGDGFPVAEDQPSTLFFSLGVAALGVAFFALSLALVQQVVFDFYSSYVQRGSAVYEAGHVR